MKLTLKLYPIDVRVLIGYLRFNLDSQEQVPLAHQSVAMLVLMDYLKRFSTIQMLTWSQRHPNKEYKLSMSLAVARSLHLEMQSQLLTGHQQLFLAKLDQAIINYRDPMSQPHVIGELIHLNS